MPFPFLSGRSTKNYIQPRTLHSSYIHTLLFHRLVELIYYSISYFKSPYSIIHHQPPHFCLTSINKRVLASASIFRIFTWCFINSFLLHTYFIYRPFSPSTAIYASTDYDCTNQLHTSCTLRLAHQHDSLNSPKSTSPITLLLQLRPKRRYIAQQWNNETSWCPRAIKWRRDPTTKKGAEVDCRQ